jgi:hypothetical protein
MLVALALIFISDYPPPSDREATRAIAIAYAREIGIDADMLGAPPAEARVRRCEWTDSRDAAAADGIWRAFDGHVCVVDIERPGEPAFQSEAFFSHDGASWAFYGSIRTPLIVEPQRFGDEETLSRLEPKAGAIRYDGLTGLFEEYAPYKHILDGHPRLGDPTPWDGGDDVVSDSALPGANARSALRR